MSARHFPYIVVGGGISGVSCVETLSLMTSECILLISASPLVKAVVNYRQVSKILEEFDVEEKPVTHLEQQHSNVSVMQTTLAQIEATGKRIVTSCGKHISYDRLCLCTGGVPKKINTSSPYVLGIRDTETVQVFQQRLKNARRIVVVGNGGIATEMVYEIQGCDIVWAIKDSSIVSTFVDKGAAAFFLDKLNNDKPREPSGPHKRMKYTHEENKSTGTQHTIGKCEQQVLGNALGPDWATGLTLQGLTKKNHSVHIEYEVEVTDVLTPEQYTTAQLQEHHVQTFRQQADTPAASSSCMWPVYVRLSNDHMYGCDFIVSATGVVPNTSSFTCDPQLTLASDGGIHVDDHLQTSVPHVWAAGDVCTAGWQHATHWLQMRLWSQARQFGAYAAQSMHADAIGEMDQLTLDFCFEMFAHSTKFFNYKVILLGKFNAQDLEDNYELLFRVTKGEEYIKVVLANNGRMQGAILIGETDLEETFENLILNQLDLTNLKDRLLDSTIDIEDYFD